MYLAIVAFAVAQSAAPATAQAPVKDKVVCKSIQEAHSRIPARVCRMKSEWTRIEKEAQDEMRRFANQRGEGYNPDSQ